jgi:hypothetical protein
MTKPIRRRAGGHARPIKTKRDYEAAAAVAKRISSRAERDSTAELRLQSLLRELDRFDEPEEEMSTGLPEEYNDSGPHRRWSDD